MFKIPTLFDRDWDQTHQVIDRILPENNWVLQIGLPAIKFDGLTVLVDQGKIYKRIILGKSERTPNGFIHIETDYKTGKYFGWIPFMADTREDTYLAEALTTFIITHGIHMPGDGTWELVGPHIRGNPYKLEAHELRSHEIYINNDLPVMTFQGIQIWLENHPQHEGIVWHHPYDYRMAKIKRLDYGLRWPIK